MNASLAGLPILALSCVFAQGPPPPAPSGVTLRATTTLVQISVAAHDSKGRAITDLKKDDFEVFDNGKPQDIAVFAAETAAPPARSSPLNAFPEDAVEPAGKPGGNAVIVLDYLNSGQIPAMRARVEIVRFLDNFDPAGKVALYVLDDSGIRLIGDFGSDRDALLKKIASVIGRPAHCNDNPEFSGTVCEPGEREYYLLQREFRTLGAIDSLADRLSFAPGRKALLWVSTATDVRAELANHSLARPTPYLDAEIERVTEKLNNADVALDPIDACGLGTSCVSHPSAMEDYAARTGGVAVHGLNGLDVAIREAVEDVRFSYSLAFYPPQDGSPTDFHHLKVQVRRPGITLKYKQGYSLAAPGTATAGSLLPPIPGAEARASAVSALVAKELALRVAAPVAAHVAASMLLPYFYTAPNIALVDLAMEFDTADLKSPKELSIDAAAYQPDGGVAARFTETVKLSFAAGVTPYRYERQFRLSSGQYNIRVSFRFDAEAAGEAQAPLIIDAWDGRALILSGIALAKETRAVADAGLDLAQGRKALIARSTETILSGSQRFESAKPCFAFLEIYEPLLSGPDPPKLGLQIRILDRQTGQPKVSSGVFSVDNVVRPGNPIVPISLTLPIANLNQGGYRLEVKATRSPGTDSATRVVDFDVD